MKNPLKKSIDNDQKYTKALKEGTVLYHETENLYTRRFRSTVNPVIVLNIV
jgi:hypothetical protein